MIGMVLVTHGKLADELRAAMEHVVGTQRNVDTVCIGPDDDMENRRAEIEALHHPLRHRRRSRAADRYVRRHSLQPCDFDDGAQGRRGHRRREPADAGQAREGAIQPAAGRRGQLRRGCGPEIHRRRVPCAARLRRRTEPTVPDDACRGAGRLPPPYRCRQPRRAAGDPDCHDRQQARPACPRRRQVRHRGGTLRRVGRGRAATASASPPAPSWG